MMQLKLSAVVIFILIIGICAADPFKCIKCDSTDDCISLAKIETEDCTTKCFTKLADNSKISRGCKAAETDECKDPSCFECDTDQCNKHNICKTCNSASSADCSQTDSNVDKFNSVCASEKTKCVKKIDDKMHVARGCASSDDESNCKGDTCVLCETPNCNIGVFPENRRRCYQCADTDTNCVNVVTNSIASPPCLLYKSDDKCYTNSKEESKMSRGCLSDIEEKTCTDDKKCIICGANSCNDRTYKHKQNLKCIQCEPSAACQWSQTSAALDCKNDIVYYEEGGCYTETFENNTVARGCIYDRNAELAECKDNCTLCTDADGCNNVNAGSFTCIRCRSDEDKNCRNEPTKAMNGTCRNPVSQDETECFSGLWNDVVIRGCLVDADNRQKYECSKDDKLYCKSCKGTSNCNIDTKFGGAAAVKITSGLFLGILIILWRLH